MRPPFLAAVAIALFTMGCSVPYTHVWAGTSRRDRLAIVSLNDGARYLIDPHSETCFLLYWGAPVSILCDKLKRNVPESAAHIRWLPDAPPGGREATVPPPSPPTQPLGPALPPS
jgi:hypothetical protein